jgi:HK97 gp10 family phage protein
MPNRISIDISEVEDNLQELLDKLPSKLDAAMNTACLAVEATAKREAPVDDGLLRASITHYTDVEEGKVTGYVGSNLEYAPYVHSGTGVFAESGKGRKEVPWHYKDEKGNWHSTSGQKPQPFLQKAIDENMSQITDYFKEVLKK